MYTQVSEVHDLDWSWVDEQLAESGMYWVAGTDDGEFPHPRPVWGVWDDDQLLLSLGSPVVNRALDANPQVTVHLESGTDVVIVEGTASVGDDDATIERFVHVYDHKYEWRYDAGEYGPPRVVRPRRVLAWRTGGFAGREGFQEVGKWAFDAT
jgi:hypothetical protein